MTDDKFRPHAFFSSLTLRDPVHSAPQVTFSPSPTMALELAASRQSKAIVTRAVDNQWRMEEVTLRAVGSDELLVRVAASGICHTDLKVGKRPQHSDRILGHEGPSITA